MPPPAQERAHHGACVQGMAAAEGLLTFGGMCERIGINPCDGLDMLTACPEWFAVDDGGRCGCASSRGMAAVRPSGPGGCGAACLPPGAAGAVASPGRRPTGPDAAPGLSSPPPAPPQPNRSAHARGRDELRAAAPRDPRTAPNLPITARQRGHACRPGYTNPYHSDRSHSTGPPPGDAAGPSGTPPYCALVPGKRRRAAAQCTVTTHPP